MSFDSLTFLLFVAIACLVRYSNRWSWQGRKAALLGMSLLFYASWSPLYLPFLLFSTALDWVVARRLDRARAQRSRRLWLLVSIVCNLGLLGYFKYSAFLSSAWREIGGDGLAQQSLGHPSPFVPLGISFFTFQTLSYTIDVYRRRLSSEHRFVDYALFVTFFPQLVSGPIVRASALLPQLEAPPLRRPLAAGYAGFLVVLGLFQKVVIADTLLGPVADAVYALGSHHSTPHTILGVLAFFGQMYADFAGYSNVAIGLAMGLGLQFKENFACPQAAASVQEFWRRWHISLGEWLRDYVYIPLGGGRRSATVWGRNITIVMVASGIWHGASLKFVAFGLAHAAVMVGAAVLRRSALVQRLGGFIALGPRIVATYVFVAVTTIPFRAVSLEHASLLVRRCIEGGDALDILRPSDAKLAAATILLMFLVQLVMRDRCLARVTEQLPVFGRALLVAVMWVAIILAGGSGRDFVYFEF